MGVVVVAITWGYTTTPRKTFAQRQRRAKGPRLAPMRRPQARAILDRMADRINAVHPGTIDLTDDRETAIALFGVMNVIVERLIAAPKHTAALYASLPHGALDAIQKRDASATGTT